MTTTNSKYVLTDDDLTYYVNKWCGHNNIDKLRKETKQGRSHTYIGFWGDDDYQSNFYHAPFKAQLPDGSWFNFDYSEQYFMHVKAVVFNDVNIDSQILNEGLQPIQYKQLGREVHNFNTDTWNTESYKAMFTACFHKFIQNEDICSQLMSTKNAVLVECSPYDDIWGIKMGKTDKNGKPTTWNKYSTWKGENRLGFILMDVRDAIKDYAIRDYNKRMSAIENIESGDDYE